MRTQRRRLNPLAIFITNIILLLAAASPARAQAGLLVYVPNQSTNNVSVFRTNADGTLTAVTTVAVGSSPTGAIVHANQAFAYISNFGSDNVSVIDTRTQTVVQTIPAGDGPRGLALNPDNTRLYVANNNGGANSVTVYSVAEGTGLLAVLTTLTSGLNGPRHLVVTPDGSRLYVVNQVGNLVRVFDTSTNGNPPTGPSLIPVGGQPIDIGLNAAGTRAYVTNLNSNSVSVIDTGSNTVVATVTAGVGSAPTQIIVSPDGNYYYVANTSSGTISQFEAATDTAIAAPISTSGLTIFGLGITPTGGFVYATNEQNDLIALFSVGANGVLTSLGTQAIGLGNSNPNGVGICGNGNKLLGPGLTFVANTAAAVGCTGPSAAFSGGTLLINNPGFTITQSFALGTAGGTINTNGNNTTVSGALSGSGALTKTGTGILTLSGPSTYTGAMAIAEGTVQAGAANVLGVNGAVNVALGATLDLAGFNQTVGALSGQGTVSLGSATLTTGGSGNPTISGTINGTGGLTKAGSGFLFLQGNNTYTGPTTVSGGNLVLTGSIVSSPVTVGFNAGLSGTGTTGPLTAQAGAMIRPGIGGPGQLTTGGIVLMPNSVLHADLAGSLPGTQYDRVAVSGNVTLGGILSVALGAFLPAPGQTFTIINATGTVAGTFAGLPNNAEFPFQNGNGAFRVTYGATSVTLTALARPTVTGAASGSVPFGGSISDTATITGGSSPTGTITFRVYGPNDATCSGTPAFTTSASVTGAGTYPSASFTPTAAGTYRWVASYSGDSLNASVSGACNDANQSVVVTKANQTITINPIPPQTIGSGPFSVSATSTSGLTVTAFSSLTTNTCTVSGNTVTLVAPGTCTIAADQGGDGNYNAAAQATQSFTVTANCSIAPAQLAVGLTAIPYNQTLTLTNGAAPVTFGLTGTLPAGVTFSNGMLSGTPAARGAYPVTATATDANGCQASASYSLAISGERRLVVGADAGGAATVRAFNIASGVAAVDFNPLPAFTGGVSVAQGDVNGDGDADIVTGAGAGGGPEVRVFGSDGTLRLGFAAFGPSFRGGVEVATGDINGDGVTEILAVGGCAAPMEVRAFDGRTGALVRTYALTPPTRSCGLHVAAGDVNGDGAADIVVGSGAFGAPLVQVVDGVSGATLRDLSPYDAGFTGGVYVAAGDVTGDGLADIITGAGSGGTPHVRVFNGATGAQISGTLGDFDAYTTAFAGGVRVAAGDLNGDGRAEVITGAGPGGGPHVRVFDGATATEIYGLYALDPSFTGGVFVAAPPAIGRMAIDIAARTTANEVRIAGWALREIATDTTGTDAIHAWAYPLDGSAPIFVGAAPARTPRPDVAAAFGGEFLRSGFDFTGTLAAGTYDLVVFVRNVRTQQFDQFRVIRATVQ